jgi:nitroreductase
VKGCHRQAVDPLSSVNAGAADNQPLAHPQQLSTRLDGWSKAEGNRRWRDEMETWDAVRSRRNVRQFTDQPLSDDDLNRILEAAWRAPSSRNLQLWDFIVVTDRAQLQQLAKVWQGGGHVAESGATVALVMDHTDDRHTRDRVHYDFGQATMAMMITAADLGIGSGHSAVGDQDLARRILRLPADRDTEYLIDFGYPADRPLTPVRHPNRRPFTAVVHRGRW